ncbi:hypothetical protein VTJ83DRAFT_5536 [Remersonia thermophila]|uniref:Velvet domain-containing protein n=1 Tax=Remersonia thermophila TaxID=72144 RepID=A0ABR4D745_9PEZI
MMSTLGQGDFELAVRQQPKYACVAIGKGKERKPIDPPPIVQLMVNPRKDPARTFLQNPYLILTARLIRKGDDDEDQSGPKESDLTGTLVSSLYSLKDTDNSQGGFFVFGDLSVRRVGTYRLAFILYELRLAEKECWLLGRTVSDPFVVYATKTFPGLAESTFLTRSFSDQGVRLRLRKDSRTVSTKKRTLSQAADSMRTGSQGAYHHHGGYLPPHDAAAHHDLGSPNGHHSPHHLRRLNTLHDPSSQLDRARGSLGSPYYSESPTQMRPGDYGSGSYGYGAYDDRPASKRPRLDGTSPDSPHAYDTDPASAYHPYVATVGHHPHAAADPRTLPSSLTSLYPLSTPTPTTTTTTTAYAAAPALAASALPMPSPYAAAPLPPRLDTTSHHPHHQHQQLQHHHPHHHHQNSPVPGSATSATFPPTGPPPPTPAGPTSAPVTTTPPSAAVAAAAAAVATTAAHSSAALTSTTSATRRSPILGSGPAPSTPTSATSPYPPYSAAPHMFGLAAAPTSLPYHAALGIHHHAGHHATHYGLPPGAATAAGEAVGE